MSQESLKDYHSMIDTCAKEGRNQPISNGLAEHAVYLMTKMFSEAKKHVRLFSKYLPDEVTRDSVKIPVYDKDELISAAVSFLEKDGTRLDILVQGDSEKIPSRSFVRSLKEKKENGEIKGVVEIRQANYKTSSIENHFMVMDSSGYRLELDHEQTKAVANFGDSVFASKLADVFDNGLFKNGTLIVSF